MFYKANIDFNKIVEEDVPYYDLTGMLLGIDGQQTEISYFTREDCVVCGTEEAAEIFRRNGIETVKAIPSGTSVSKGEHLLAGRGEASNVFSVWKPGQNLIDHLSGIATKTRKMADKAHSVSPNFPVMATRKMFPGTKALAVKAVLAGGGAVHRLGLSETVLIFRQHMNIIGGEEVLLARLPEMKRKCCEKKIFVEAESAEEANRFLAAGADGIQFDKLKPEELTVICAELKKMYPHAAITAAGGINETNVDKYASAGIDGVVTSALYSAAPVDIGTKIGLVGD